MLLNAAAAETAFITAINSDLTQGELQVELRTIVNQFNLYLIATHTPGLLVKDAQNLLNWAWTGHEDAGYDVVETHYIRLVKEAGKA